MSKNKIPSLINGSAGSPKLEIVGKKSDCKGCGGGIAKGEKCFDIPNPRKAFSSSRRFCLSCFKHVLEKTAQHLDDLSKGLNTL